MFVIVVYMYTWTINEPHLPEMIVVSSTVGGCAWPLTKHIVNGWVYIGTYPSNMDMRGTKIIVLISEVSLASFPGSPAWEPGNEAKVSLVLGENCM